MTHRVTRRLSRRLLVLLLGLLGLAGTGLLLAAPALAHASVVASTPADGSRLRAAPHTVTITFDESVGISNGLGYLHVTNQSGKRVDARAAYHPGGDGAKVVDDLTGNLGDGTYTASFRVISADSHPVAGTIRFVVGDGALAHGNVAQSATNRGTSTVFDIARWVSYAGLALLGGAWLPLTIWPQGRTDLRAVRIVWTGWGAVFLGGMAELVLQGPFTAGSGVGEAADWSLLNGTLHTDFGQLHCVRLVLLGLLALVLGRALSLPGGRAGPTEVGAAVLGVALVATFAGTGHAASTNPTTLSMPLDALHLVSMAVWMGGLVVLLAAVLPRREPAELRSVLPTFSTVAFVSVAVLGGTGTYAAFRGVGTVDALFTTVYGLLVFAKIMLFLALLALGNLSRLAVRRRAVAYAMTAEAMAGALLDTPPPDRDVDVERLRRSVFVEVLVGVVVLAVTAVLVAEPRGKEALIASYRTSVSASASLGDGRSVTVESDTGLHGSVDLTVRVSRSSGAEAGTAVTAVTASATQQAAQLGPLPVQLTRRGAGDYEGTVTLPVAGAWDIDLAVTEGGIATTTDVVLRLH
ncbi:copper resistance protein CopC [uncultured Jatrophihabitans sp.]|uniref:copper resistance CopC/CopD family protein n=1 Tax=uncultured Jatrophihabitans sp. TaxID=1610747 RepID=UPI0035CBEA74